MSHAAEKPKKTFRCVGCGDTFEYTRRKPKYCPECRKDALYAMIGDYKKRRRKLLRKGNKEEHLGGKIEHSLIGKIGGMSHVEIATALDLKVRRVAEIEREALLKIRTNFKANPELKKIWDSVKLELANGAQLPESAAENKGELLLEYQLSVVDWHQQCQEMLDEGLTDEALQLLDEIMKFQNEIAKALAL